MSLETPVHIAQALAERGYNAQPEAVTLLASAPDPDRALDRALETLPEDAIKLTAEHVEQTLETDSSGENVGRRGRQSDPETTREPSTDTLSEHPSVSGGDEHTKSTDAMDGEPAETTGGESSERDAQTGRESAPSRSVGQSDAQQSDAWQSDDDSTIGNTGQQLGGTRPGVDPERQSVEITGDMTGRSTGTGEYSDFVAVFRDRYERLGDRLRSRVNHRPTNAIEAMGGGSEASLVGMVSDIRSTASGHWLVELEDTNGTFPCLVMKDRDIADLVDELLLDEVIAVEGTLADDAGILFVDAMHFPDVPRTYEPSTADRHVEAALISDVHVGSQEFLEDAWYRFAEWLHTDEAESVEYLLIAGDMVEGVGVYPDQDEELDVVDIYDQYRTFSEHLKAVPGDMEIIMIPGNHDAVRLAEPQPAFDEELRSIMSAHDARFTSNPSTVTVEGVSVLMYHGMSLDEVIAELPEEKASYENPHRAMEMLLKKRHVAPMFGGKTRVAPEAKDHLVIDDVPDVFHTGHVHKLGYGKYHNVLTINSGCWQAQTAFQKSVNIDPDYGFAPIVSLDTLDLTVRSFAYFGGRWHSEPFSRRLDVPAVAQSHAQAHLVERVGERDRER